MLRKYKRFLCIRFAQAKQVSLNTNCGWRLMVIDELLNIRDSTQSRQPENLSSGSQNCVVPQSWYGYLQKVRSMGESWVECNAFRIGFAKKRCPDWLTVDYDAKARSMRSALFFAHAFADLDTFDRLQRRWGVPKRFRSYGERDKWKSHL